MTRVAPAQVAAALAVLGERGRPDAPLGALTTYRVGGPAAVLVEAGDDDDLAAAGRAATESGLPVLVVGKGSNLLVADDGYPGIAVVLGGGYDRVEPVVVGAGPGVTAGGATALPRLARRTAALGLTGLEWAVGVPGSVGGAVRMNAGGHGSDVAATLDRATVFDLVAGTASERPAADLGLGYRRSAVGPTEVVTAATFALVPGDPAASEAQIAEIVRWRRENQPGGQNAGSVFTNPAGDSAGRLVEAAGCKGLRLGTAEVSAKHANFIQADPGGRAADVVALIREVRRRVEDHAGVRLVPELRLAGFGPDPVGTDQVGPGGAGAG